MTVEHATQATQAQDVTAVETALHERADAPPHTPALIHAPVDVRSLSLVIIALLLTLYALQWAKAVIVPILMGLMLSYALAPAVNLLHRRRVPRPAGAALVLASVVAAACWGVWSLGDQANALVQSLPESVQKIRRLAAGNPSGAPSKIATMQQAAAELEKVVQEAASASAPAASGASGASAASMSVPALRETSARAAARRESASSRDPTRVVVVSPGANIRDYLWTGTLGAAEALGQTAIVLSIALFLLASGDSFRRKLVRLAGPTMSHKKITVQMLNEITEQIQRYLMVQLGISVIVGVLTAGAFYALGVNEASVWGVVAGLTNLIPYVGAIATGLAAAVVVATQFGAVDMGLIAAATSFGIHAVVGNILTPWWMGRTSRISPIAVFLSLLIFGWLWGVAGLLLGVPMLMVTKAVCDRVEELQPIGELLGE